jgi:hypothetical protein
MVALALMLLAATHEKAPPAPWAGNEAPSQAVVPPKVAKSPPVPAEAEAEAGPSRSTILYLDVTQFVTTCANLEAEHHLGDSLSVYGSAALSMAGFGWSLQGGARVYFPRLTESGWRPFLDAHARGSHSELLWRGDAAGWGGLLGLRLMTDSGFTVSLGAGADYVYGETVLFFPGSLSRIGWGARLSFRSAVGYAF